MTFAPRNLIAFNVWSGGQRADTRSGPLQTVRRLADPGAMPRTCQWPAWNDQERATHRYCGKANAAGRVYCDEHCARAFLGYKQTRMPGLATSGEQGTPCVVTSAQAGAVGSNAVPAAPVRRLQAAAKPKAKKPRINKGGLRRTAAPIDIRLCIDDFERAIVAASNSGKSQREIGRMLGVSHCAIAGKCARIRKREVEE